MRELLQQGLGARSGTQAVLQSNRIHSVPAQLLSGIIEIGRHDLPIKLRMKLPPPQA